MTAFDLYSELYEKMGSEASVSYQHYRMLHEIKNLLTVWLNFENVPVAKYRDFFCFKSLN